MFSKRTKGRPLISRRSLSASRIFDKLTNGRRIANRLESFLARKTQRFGGEMLFFNGCGSCSASLLGFCLVIYWSGPVVRAASLHVKEWPRLFWVKAGSPRYGVKRAIVCADPPSLNFCDDATFAERKATMI